MSKRVVLALVGGSIIVAAAALWFFSTRPFSLNSSTTPTFATVLPKDTSIADLGGWQTKETPSGEHIYTYYDTLDGVGIIVTQQQQPTSFAADPEKALKDIADGFNASTALNVEGAIAYTGVSSQGPEWAVIAINDLLVLIQAESSLPPSTWESYISSLQ